MEAVMSHVLPLGVVNMIMDDVAGLEHRDKFKWTLYSIRMVGIERLDVFGNKITYIHHEDARAFRSCSSSGMHPMNVSESVYSAQHRIISTILYIDIAAWSARLKHYHQGVARLWKDRYFMKDGYGADCPLLGMASCLQTSKSVVVQLVKGILEPQAPSSRHTHV